MSTGVRRLVSLVCTLALGAMLLVALGACHTVKGVGRDIESLGQGGQDIIDGKK